MKRYIAFTLLMVGLTATPSQAQLLQKLQENFLGPNQNQQQGAFPAGQQQPFYPAGQGLQQQPVFPAGQGLQQPVQQPGGKLGFIQGLLGAGQNQGQQANLVGTVNLPPGQYMMNNVQTGQAFYVQIQNGQMYLGQQPTSQISAPGQFGLGQQQQQQQPAGFGGLLKNGVTNFLQNQITPQSQPAGQ